MDAQRELRQMQREVMAEVDRKVLEATAKIYGKTPEEYKAGLIAAGVSTYLSGIEAVGAYYGGIYRAFQELAEGFARGFELAARPRSQAR